MLVKTHPMLNYEIKLKYLKAPSFDEIYALIQELGISYSQFERYFTMPEGIIRHIKQGTHKLPVKYWPIIYDRIIPQYGIGYKKNIEKKSIKRFVSKTVSIELENDTHGRVNKIK